MNSDDFQIGKAVEAAKKKAQELAVVFERIYSQDPEQANLMLRQLAREDLELLRLVAKWAGPTPFKKAVDQAVAEIG